MRYELIGFMEASELDEEALNRVIRQHKKNLLEELSELPLGRIEDYHSIDAREAAEAAIRKCEELRTPWFFTAYLYDQEIIRNIIEQQIQQHLSEHLFTSDGFSTLHKNFVEPLKK